MFPNIPCQRAASIPSIHWNLELENFLSHCVASEGGDIVA